MAKRINKMAPKMAPRRRGKPGKVEGATAEENRASNRDMAMDGGMDYSRATAGMPRLDVSSGMAFDSGPEFIRNWASSIQDGMTGKRKSSVIDMDNPNY